MNAMAGPGLDVSRRHWIVLAMSALAGCGGASGGADGGLFGAAAPGTGGTGIYASGSIAGFGSVIINGVRYDDSAAQIQINGVPAAATDLRLGMVAGVTGERGADPLTGTASHVEVWSVARGCVSAVAAGQISLMGMTLKTRASTVLDGWADASAIQVGQSVVVWGLQADAGARTWTATRIGAAPEDRRSVTTGLVSVSNGSASINGVSLGGAKASGLSEGQLVRAEGVWDAATRALVLESATVVEIQRAPSLRDDVEIEGVVTALLPDGHFAMGALVVDGSDAGLGQAYAELVVGAHIEVSGTWQGQVLKARRIEAEERSEGGTEISGTIQSFTSVSDFVLRNQRCDASGATKVEGGQLSELRAGVKVQVKGTITGDLLRVSSVGFKD